MRISLLVLFAAERNLSCIFSRCCVLSTLPMSLFRNEIHPTRHGPLGRRVVDLSIDVWWGHYFVDMLWHASIPQSRIGSSRVISYCCWCSPWPSERSFVYKSKSCKQRVSNCNLAMAMKRPACGIFTSREQDFSGFSFGQNVSDASEAMRSCDANDVEEVFSPSDAIATPLLYNTSPILLHNFYQILKVASDADENTIIGAHVKLLVRLPFVAAYMDKFANADATRWSDLWESFKHYRRKPLEDRERFDALMIADARLCSKSSPDCAADPADLKLLGLTSYSGPASAAQALKTQLLLIPRCDLQFNLYPGWMFCGCCASSSPQPEPYETEHWEQVRVAACTFNDDASRTLYDKELSFDTEPTSQWHATLRAILRWRYMFLDEDALRGRLAWLRTPERCSCPLFSGSTVLDKIGGGDERRYVLLSLLDLQPGPRWATKQAAALHADVVGASTGSAFDDQLTRDELAIVLAELKERDMVKDCGRMHDELLRVRSAEKTKLFDGAGEEYKKTSIDQWWAKSHAGLALHESELKGGLLWIEAQESTCESAEQPIHARRRSRQQERIHNWDKQKSVAEILIEKTVMGNILENRAAATHICCLECRVYKDQNDFRREGDGHIARTKRCQECEFPNCESCERQRSLAEEPVLVREKVAQTNGRKEEGHWYTEKNRKSRHPETRPCRPIPRNKQTDR